MSDQERMIALEREVIDTRKAAALLILGWLNHSDPSMQLRQTAVQWFEDAAIDADMVTARLARLVSGALRRT